ncbi:enoyl-CoA hydratase/isomerase family protein [bacterium]|nr:enoyl-CoA hydratase/isomerase family protein [bacterium]
MSKGEIRYDVDGAVATITISRPGKKNSLTLEMFDELGEAVQRSGREEGLRVLVIMGDGDEALAAGVDLSAIVNYSAEEARTFSIRGQDILTSIEALPFPVISAVKGFALGGGLELSLACDLIVAAEDARLGLPETNLGIIPGLGGCIRLPKRVGLGRARELIYSGRIVGGKQALALGLVDAVFPLEQFDVEVRKIASLLASKSPSALALAKSTLNRGMDASLEAGLALERETFAYCFSLPDAKEGISAFLEKRKPVFEK